MMPKTFHAQDTAVERRGRLLPPLYLGVALLLAWQFTVWFVPEVFLCTELMDDDITYAWLIMLGASAATMAAVPSTLGRKRRAPSAPQVTIVMAGLASAAGLAFCALVGTTRSAVVLLVFPAVMAVCASMLWLQWGEYYVSVQARFELEDVALTCGTAILAGIAMGTFLPQPTNTVIVACMPLVSGVLLVRAVRKRDGDEHYPAMLPAPDQSKSMRNMVVVCSIACAASAASYFTIAIIPTWDLPGDETFTVGVVLGAIVLLGIGLAGKDVERVFPCLLVACAISMLLYLSGNVQLYPLSFLVAVALTTIYEILLVMYVGVLSFKGYLVPTAAFGYSSAYIYFGMFAGNCLAVFFEHHTALEPMALVPVTVLLAATVVALIIPLVRREYITHALLAPVKDEDGLEERVRSVARQFELSEREEEVLYYLAQGYSAPGIADKLTISRFTVQTHIQHIYEKLDIHKRSDVIDYVNKRQG